MTVSVNVHKVAHVKVRDLTRTGGPGSVAVLTDDRRSEVAIFFDGPDHTARAERLASAFAEDFKESEE